MFDSGGDGGAESDDVCDPFAVTPAERAARDRGLVRDLDGRLAAPDPEEEAAARILAELEPCGDAAVVAEYTATDPAELNDAELVDTIVGFDRLARWVHGNRARLISEFAHRRPGDAPEAVSCPRPSVGSRWAPDELGLALGVGRMQAKAILAESVTLTRVLPDTLAALHAGVIDAGKARALTELLLVLSPDQVREVEARVLPKAGEQTSTQFRAALRRAVLRVDPDGANRRHAAARTQRRVVVAPEDDGMSTLWALLPATDAAAGWQMLTRVARGLGPDDPRSLDERRADLLVDLITGRLTLHQSDSTPDAPAHSADDPVDLADAVDAERDARPEDNSDDVEPVDLGGAAGGSAAGGNLAAGSSAAGSPVAESPVAESPVAESPVAESPVAESSAAEMPAAGRPVAESSARVSADADVTRPSGPVARPGTYRTADRSVAAGADLSADRAGSGSNRDPDSSPDRSRDRADAGREVVADSPGTRAAPDRRAPGRDGRYPCGCPATAGRRGGPAANGGGRGEKPLVQIVVGLDTLLGTRDLPAELVGYGPIPSDLARSAAADAVWKRLVANPLSGALLDHGRTVYRPPAALNDFVKARDVTCRFPTCNRRALDCDLDHLQRWADGGETDEVNLNGFCGQHHALKEQPGWQVVAHIDGSLTWITPTGHRHVSRPHDYREQLPDRPTSTPGRPSGSGDVETPPEVPPF